MVRPNDGIIKGEDCASEWTGKAMNRKRSSGSSCEEKPVGVAKINIA